MLHRARPDRPPLKPWRRRKVRPTIDALCAAPMHFALCTLCFVHGHSLFEVAIGQDEIGWVILPGEDLRERANGEFAICPCCALAIWGCLRALAEIRAFRLLTRRRDFRAGAAFEVFGGVAGRRLRSCYCGGWVKGLAPLIGDRHSGSRVRYRRRWKRGPSWKFRNLPFASFLPRRWHCGRRERRTAEMAGVSAPRTVASGVN